MRFHLDVVQKIALAPFLIGARSIYVGEEGSLPAFTGLGAILIAAAPAVMGLHAVVTGRIALRIDRYGAYEEVYRSIGARAWGLLFMLSSRGAVLRAKDSSFDMRTHGLQKPMKRITARAAEI